MTLTLGISPCPNDTFIFDALVNGRLDTGDLRLEVVHEDVQTLNRWALAGRLDVTKLSYGVLPDVVDGPYALLEAGGALGRGVGPLLVARPGVGLRPGPRPASPSPASRPPPTCSSRWSTPARPASASWSSRRSRRRWPAGEVDAGVIIHEGRFTYAARGLVRLLDLGEAWEQRTGAPIPLGGIVARRALGRRVLRRLDGLIRASVEAAWAGGGALSPYVKRHAQELDEAVMRQHIELYVNEHSLALGPEGRRAVEIAARVHARHERADSADRCRGLRSTPARPLTGGGLRQDGRHRPGPCRGGLLGYAARP